jgi:hypothetical protein
MGPVNILEGMSHMNWTPSQRVTTSSAHSSDAAGARVMAAMATLVARATTSDTQHKLLCLNQL